MMEYSVAALPVEASLRIEAGPGVACLVTGGAVGRLTVSR